MKRCVIVVGEDSSQQLFQRIWELEEILRMMMGQFDSKGEAVRAVEKLSDIEDQLCSCSYQREQETGS